MRFEKISDSQIRCILDKKDLLDREIKISEFAYGSEKARELFGELMNKAYYELGFELDDAPLMIEAIPVSMESLVLVVTKVESPDELDTRFSNFSPYSEDDEEEDDEYADCEDISVSKEFKEINTLNKGVKTSIDISEELLKVYTFESISAAAPLAHAIAGCFRGRSAVYKSTLNDKYYLILGFKGISEEECNKIYNIISEFAEGENSSYAAYSYYIEHFDVIIKENALQIIDKYY